MSLKFLDNKSVLITGGTGSFGKKCILTLLEKSLAKRIIIFSRDELKQSQMKAEISDPENRLRFFIGDVRDKERLERAFDGVEYVIHAAALKQVPALEYNPFEAIKTNVLGTKNVIDAAIDRGVERVLLISTDKAANPANLYGASKLCAERLMISGNSYAKGKTKLGILRYGNVFGSRGSLVEVIKKQRENGIVDITHEEMTRFWITLEQGIAFALMSLEKMHGGEIFIPKIPSMSVKDFITTLAPDCRLNVIGIRPGEKLHEILITPEEARHAREFDTYYVILPEFEWWQQNNYADGKNLPGGFHFSSHTNPDQLVAEDLVDLLETKSK